MITNGKKYICLLALSTLIYACSGDKNTAQTGTDDPKENTGAEGFDLSSLTMKEKIGVVLKANGLTLEKGKSSDLKAYGYESFTSTDPKLLKYAGADLSGSNKDSVNKTIIYYSLKDSVIGMVEVNLFTPEKISLLNSGLEKTLGKAPYPDDAYPAKPFSKNIQFRNYVWADTVLQKSTFMMHMKNDTEGETGRLMFLRYPDMLQLAGVRGYSVSIGSEIEEAINNTKK